MLPFELTKDTPYLALSGELWSVFYEYFNRNWSCYKGFLLYNCNVLFTQILSHLSVISTSKDLTIMYTANAMGTQLYGIKGYLKSLFFSGKLKALLKTCDSEVHKTALFNL